MPQGPLTGEYRRATIMFTDMVGYSALMGRDQTAALELLEEHRTLVRPVFEEFAGREVKTIGDAFMVIFEDAAAAIRCALKMQALLRARNAAAPEGARIRLRIGVHTGEFFVRHGDLYGDDVNIAARIEPLARPGGVCASESAMKAAGALAGIRWVRLGEAELRNIRERHLLFDVREADDRRGVAIARARFLIAQPRWRRITRAVGAAGFIALVASIPLRSWLRPQVSSLGVADFANESGDRDLDGIAGMLVTDLEQSRSFTVLSRSAMHASLRRMGRTDPDLLDEKVAAEACRGAGVTALITGTTRKFDEIYSLEAALVDARDGRRWFSVAERANGRGEIPAAIDRLSKAIRERLREDAADIGRAQVNAAAVTSGNLEAYRYYFLAETALDRAHFSEALPLLRRAISIDPEFALAQYRLAYVLHWRHMSGAHEATVRALSLADRLPEKERLFLAALDARERNDEPAEDAALQQVLQRFPSEPQSVFEMGDHHFHRGSLAQARPFFERSVQLDPTFGPGWNHLWLTEYGLGDIASMPATAQSYSDRTHSIDAGRLLVASLLLAGREQDARREADRQAAVDGKSALDSQLELGQYLVVQGRIDEAISFFRSLSGLDATGDRIARAIAWAEAAGGRVGAASEELAHSAGNSELSSTPSEDELSAHARRVGERAFLLSCAPARRAEAQAAIDELRRLASDDAWVSSYLVFALDGLGSYEDEANVAEASAIPALQSYAAGRKAMLAGDPARAYDLFAKARNGPLRFWNEIVISRMAEARIAQGRNADAIDLLEGIERGRMFSEFWAMGVPRAHLLEARVLEKEHRGDEARAQYEKLIELWSKADPDLPELGEARARLAALAKNARPSAPR